MAAIHQAGIQPIGPVLTVVVQHPVGSPQSCGLVALVDTGSAVTIVEQTIVAQLGLPITGTGMAARLGQAKQSATTHQAVLLFPGTPLPSVSSTAVFPWDIASTGDSYRVIVGRDVLSLGILVYDGPAGRWTLSL
jgi:hypothetical protein